MSLFDERQGQALRVSESLGLPCPRLQFTWLALPERSEMYNAECLYTLVIPLRAYDIRAEMEDGSKRREHHALIGHTRAGGSSNVDPAGEVRTPFRDGAHAEWDAGVLGGLPVYAVCGDQATRVRKGEG